MTEVQRVILISFGVLRKEGNCYYGKDQVIKYYHEFSEYVEEVIVVANQLNDNELDSELDQSSVTPILSGYGSAGGPIRQLIGLILTNLKILTLLNRRTAVIINCPSIAYTLLIPILYYRSGHLSVYVGSNPDEVVELQRARGGLFEQGKALLTRLQAEFMTRYHHSLLYRGGSARYENIGRAHESKPIINLLDREAISTGGTNGIREILYVGGLYKRKGLSNLLKAFQSLVSNSDINQDLRLRIVGQGSERKRLEDLARELSIYSKVCFEGWVNDPEKMAQIYTSASVFVLPSLIAEGSPRVIDEAHYYGTPVVATNLGYYADEIRDGENVLLVESGSSEAIVSAVERLLTDAEFTQRIVRNGFRRARALLEETAAHQHATIVTGSPRFCQDE